MKKLVTAKGEFLNYSSITKELDHWKCDGVVIPFTIAGDEGTIEEYVHIPEPMPIEVPQSLTPRQTRLALLQATLLDEVETMLSTNREMQIWWEYSLEILRDHPHIIAMGTALGLTESQLDELFIAGANL